MLHPQNKASIDNDRWIRCVHCGHKLGRVIKSVNRNDCCVEIKCHSCKTINLCYVTDMKRGKVYDRLRKKNNTTTSGV